MLKTPEGMQIDNFHPRAPPKYNEFPTTIVESPKSNSMGGTQSNLEQSYQRISSVKLSALQFGGATAPQIMDAANWFLRIFWIIAYIGLSGTNK